jgi:hypothetical protein
MWAGILDTFIRFAGDTSASRSPYGIRPRGIRFR